jgi:hypothetical protein
VTACSPRSQKPENISGDPRAEISLQIDYQKVAASRSETGDFHFVELLPDCRYSSAISASANMNLVHYPFFSPLLPCLL